MDWQSGRESPAQLLPPSLNTYSVPHLPEDDLNQSLTLAWGSNGANPAAIPLPQWIQSPLTSYDHVKFFGDMLTSPLLEGVQSPLSDTHSPNGISEIQGEMLYNSSVKPAGFRPAYISHDMDAWKARILRPQIEGEPVNNNTMSTESQAYDQDHSSVAAKQNLDTYGDSLPRSRAQVSASRYLSKNKSYHRQKATSNDRRRRLRIEEGLVALCQLLPHSKENDKASQLDDVIDHIKLLQLHIKELCRSKLAGQSTSDPFVFVEGYGHFLLHEQMLEEPLEEMMAKLLEVDPSSAALLLESRGLSMMPLDLADRFQAV